jgi:hypothetical protein
MLRVLFCALAALCAASADTLTLKSGKVVQGTYLGGDARQLRIAAGDRVETYEVGEISDIKFGSTAPPDGNGSSPVQRRERNEVLRPERSATPKPSPRTAVEVPAGTAIVVRMIDDVDSERDSIGKTFRASLDEAVVLNGEAIIPRGADVTAKLIDDKESGKLSGRTELTLDLVTIQVGGRNVDILTQEVTTASDSRTAKTGKVVGGTAAVGAIIGAIAGGGKGAAIGAASGAGAGTAVQVLTKGQRVRIPSETRLTFTLQQPVKI